MVQGGSVERAALATGDEVLRRRAAVSSPENRASAIPATFFVRVWMGSYGARLRTRFGALEGETETGWGRSTARAERVLRQAILSGTEGGKEVGEGPASIFTTTRSSIQVKSSRGDDGTAARRGAPSSNGG